jgi:DNA-binding transcriptional regulator GbsR (MarR family)
MLVVADAASTVCLSTVADKLDLNVYNIQNSWKRLVDLNLIKLQGRDQRKKHYERRESAAWEWARELAGDLWMADDT